jgi:trehalose-phosphatase
MIYLFDEWRNIKKKLAGKNILLFLDYDGTLASIADHPDKAVLTDKIRDILNKVVNNSRFKVAVISGRSLKDIKARVGINDIIYSGNHGLQIDGPLFRFENNIASAYKILLVNIKKELYDALVHFKGILIEDKELTLTIHYRLADKELISNIIEVIDKTVATYRSRGEIEVRGGKMIIEIFPPGNWNKGSAVLWILGRQEFLKNDFYPVYFGDDLTDEDAFEALRNSGLTVLVGHRDRSQAQYYLNDVQEMGKFAELL